MTPADLVTDDQPPPGVSPVVTAFLRLHIDWAWTPAEWRWLDDLVQASGELNATLLAEGILRSLDIPEDAIGGDTLGHAFRYLGFAQEAERRHNGQRDDLYVLASTAASLAGEALAEWSRINGWPAWGDTNHPYTVLTQAFVWVRGHG